MFSEDINDSVSKFGDEYNFLYSPLQKSLLTIPGMTVDLEERFKAVNFFTTYQIMGYFLQTSKEKEKSEEIIKNFVEIFFYEMKDDSYHITLNIKGEITGQYYADEEYECVLNEEELKRVNLVLYMILKKLEIFFPNFVDFPEEEDDMM